MLLLWANTCYTAGMIYLLLPIFLLMAACSPAPEATAPEDLSAIDISMLAAPYNTADLENGRKNFNRCKACHTIIAGGADRVGPNLHGVFDRVAGEKAGFNYSDALQQADFQWTPEQLDQWLQSPREFLPGNRMSFAGLKDETDRRDLITYLLVKSAPSAE